MFGGFVNRWLIWWVERGNLQPDGGNVPAGLLNDAADELKTNLTQARRGDQMSRTATADQLWRDLYHELAYDDPPGMLGHALNRSAPQCLRLSVVLALADGARVITGDLINAARHTWNYCHTRRPASSAKRPPPPTPNDSSPTSRRRTRRPRLHRTAHPRQPPGRKAEAARLALEEAALAHTTTVPTNGRPRSITYAIAPAPTHRP